MIFFIDQEREDVNGEDMENNGNKSNSLKWIGFENVQKPF